VARLAAGDEREVWWTDADLGRAPTVSFANKMAKHEYQLRQFCGLFSFDPGLSVHVWYVGWHLRALVRALAVFGR
jgi:hypothetical protein